VSTLGNLDWGAVMTGYLGVFLQGATLMALGLMFSSWTSNQIIAFFLAIGAGVFFFMIDRFLPFMPGWLATMASYLSMGEHVASMARGVIDTRDVFYFASISGMALAVAFLALSSRRWR
jgi:ABC-2 type transport system permease protein